MKFICLLLLTIASLNCFSESATAQQRKVPKEPFQIVDASTGKQIPELLVIPRYSSFAGVSTMLGEGPSSGADQDYVDKPFIYRSGEPFIIKRPKSIGIPLLPFIFVGKGRSIQGVLFVAQKYRPMRIYDLWSVGDKRKLQLTPISNSEWSQLLEKELSPFVKGASLINSNCGIWDLPENCNLKIQFDEKERELVQSFLQKDRIENK